MKPFFKNNSKALVILLLSVTILLIGLTANTSKPVYTKSSTEILANLDGLEHVLNFDAQDWQRDTVNYVFIDLRSQVEYETHHIENAINVPVSDLLTDETLDRLLDYQNREMTMVLYGKHERDAVSPWVMLQRIGISNSRVLYGGFDCFYDQKPECPTGYANYNFAEIASQGGEKEIEIFKEKPKPVSKKKKEIPVKKKVKAEAEGGC